MNNLNIYTILLLLVFSFTNAKSEDLTKIKDLAGTWKFSIGNNERWKDPNFKDNNWDNINVPGAWENQGFHGYDGYAWYRTTFELNYNNKTPLFLGLGYIDDADEVYLNGKLIANRGSFPPNFSTAYNAKRTYKIPEDALHRNGINYIAIKVYDEWSAGGIIWGDIGVFASKNAIPVELNLEGLWKFKINDCDVNNINDIDFSSWKNITVPSQWEDQGYKDFDGLACYAKTFELDSRFINKDVVLVLGKIDDFDQVYVNGKFIGQHGNWPNNKTKHNHDTFYNEKRGYYLPKNTLNNNGINTIIVRVRDIGGTGGIYFGEIGLISQKEYTKHWNSIRD